MLGYVTVEEADKYIETHYLSTDEPRIYWQSLQQTDKEILLCRAAETINLLPFPGKKADSSQENAFPRYPSTETPKAIGNAQVEIAVSNGSSDKEESSMYSKMKAWGIKSYTINDLSETIGEGGGQSNILMDNGVFSTTAQSILEPYLGGGYSVE